MNSEDIGVAIRAAVAMEFKRHGTRDDHNRAIWDAACEACAKACEENGFFVENELHGITINNAEDCRALKVTP